MRKILNFCLLIALLSVFGVVSAQNNGNGPRTPRTSVTVSSGNQPFWLFIDDVLQNENSVSSIRVDAIPEGKHYMRVELDNEDHLTIGQFVTLQRRNTYWIENQRNLFGLSADRGATAPELVVFYKYVRQDYPHNSYGPARPENYRPAWDKPEYDNPSQQIVTVPEETVPMVAMYDKDFQMALDLIKKESFENGKITVAQQVVDNNFLNISQIKQICAVFDFDKSRLEFVKSAYPKCVEKNNYYLLNSVFDFSSSKMDFDKFLQSQK